MSGVEYDLDTSGGLMEQIQALIAPPQSDNKEDKPTKKSEHPYFKRPGKGHNHDSCDACGEGGDLICCDKCPSSFHLQCHDPPLEEKDIPSGEWLCHCCKSKKVQGAPQTRKRSTSTPATSVRINNKKAKTTPMDILIQAASSMNPRQFELPRSMSFPCIFPGTDKVELPYSRNGRKQIKNRDHEKNKQDNLILLPAKKCNECRKSCRIAPLISCDYCPLYFHLDCLDPPLTTPPSGRWMCPNHVEHFLDSKLLTSISATERVKLWDQFTGPIDQDSIKLEFLRKVRSKNPPFRYKIKLAPRKCAKIPEMVKYHYRNPVKLLPSLRNVLRLETLNNREYMFYNNEANENDDDVKKETINEEVREEKQQQKPEEIKVKETEEKTQNVKELQEVPQQSEEVEQQQDQQQQQEMEQESEQPPQQEEQMEEDEKDKQENVIKEDEIKTEMNSEESEEDLKKELVNGEEDNDNKDFFSDFIDDITEEVELELKQLDNRLLKLLAYQRIQHLLLNQSNSNTLQFLSTELKNKLRQMPMPSELLTAADIERIYRVFATPSSSIANRKTKTTKIPRSSLRARAMLCPVVSPHFYNVRTSEVSPKHVRHDDSFLGFRPTVSARYPEAIAMRYRILNIGKGSNNDVDLERFGPCNNISTRHAVIFFDEFTKTFEVINYSPFGTYVNNILFTNDIIWDRPKAKEPCDLPPAVIETQVRDLIDKRRKVERPTPRNLFEAKMTANDNCDAMECHCTLTNQDTVKTGGWESSAVLSHGCLLRFGCISFVFSIVESSL